MRISSLKFIGFSSISSFRFSSFLVDLQTSCEYGAQFGPQALVVGGPQHAGAMGVEQHADGGGKFRLDELIGHAGKRHGITEPRGYAQHTFGHLEQAGEAGSAAGEDTAGAERAENAALA